LSETPSERIPDGASLSSKKFVHFGLERVGL
jgi:hypothetical protein